MKKTLDAWEDGKKSREAWRCSLESDLEEYINNNRDRIVGAWMQLSGNVISKYARGPRFNSRHHIYTKIFRTGTHPPRHGSPMCRGLSGAQGSGHGARGGF